MDFKYGNWFDRLFTKVEFDNEKTDFVDAMEKEERTRVEKDSETAEWNRSVATKVFKVLEANGIEVKDVQRHNGYFVFDMGDCSVVHFRVGGFWMRKWKFGMWLNRENENYALSLFAQFDDYIDKFKPSASGICFELTLADVENLMGLDCGKTAMYELPFKLYCFVKCVRSMAAHPCLALAGAFDVGGKFFCERISPLGVAWDFLKDRISHNAAALWRKIRATVSFRWNMLRLQLMSLSPMVDRIIVEDFTAKNGLVRKERFTLIFYLRAGTSTEAATMWANRHLKSLEPFGKGDGEFWDSELFQSEIRSTIDDSSEVVFDIYLPRDVFNRFGFRMKHAKRDGNGVAVLEQSPKLYYFVDGGRRIRIREGRTIFCDNRECKDDHPSTTMEFKVPRRIYSKFKAVDDAKIELL